MPKQLELDLSRVHEIGLHFAGTIAKECFDLKVTLQKRSKPPNDPPSNTLHEWNVLATRLAPDLVRVVLGLLYTRFWWRAPA